MDKNFVEKDLQENNKNTDIIRNNINYENEIINNDSIKMDINDNKIIFDDDKLLPYYYSLSLQYIGGFNKVTTIYKDENNEKDMLILEFDNKDGIYRYINYKIKLKNIKNTDSYNKIKSIVDEINKYNIFNVTIIVDPDKMYYAIEFYINDENYDKLCLLIDKLLSDEMYVNSLLNLLDEENKLYLYVYDIDEENNIDIILKTLKYIVFISEIGYLLNKLNDNLLS